MDQHDLTREMASQLARGNAAKDKAIARANVILPKSLHTVRILELVAREWMKARDFKVGEVYASDAVLAAARICGYSRATVHDPIVARVIRAIGEGA